MSSEGRAVIKVFCSYSDEDRPFQERLEKHLTSLVRVGSVLVWDKHKVKPGQEHRREIDEQLMHIDELMRPSRAQSCPHLIFILHKQARLILLLISSNFISSDDCYASDLVKALQRYQDDKIRVIPILLKPCTWDELAFSPFQVLPRNRVPVSLWKNRDLAFTHIVEEIKTVVQELLQYGDGYIEPLPMKPVSRAPTVSSQAPLMPQRTRTPQGTNATQKKDGTGSNKQRNTLKAEAIKPTTMRSLKSMPKSHPISLGSTIWKFLTSFFSNISGRAFRVRCKRWKGNSALLLVLFALLDIFLLPYTVYQRSHSPKLTGAIGVLSLLLFSLGVFNEDNVIGVPVALIYFPIWLAMGIWYLNSYLGLGLSQLAIFLLIFITTIGRLLLFLWRSPFGSR